MKQGTIGRHDATLSSVGFAIRNLEERVEEWRRWFDLGAGQRFEDDHLGATCQLIHASGANLLFCEPRDEGPARNTLETRGEVPFLVTFSNTQIAKDIHMMGAVYRFQS